MPAKCNLPLATPSRRIAQKHNCFAQTHQKRVLAARQRGAPARPCVGRSLRSAATAAPPPARLPPPPPRRAPAHVRPGGEHSNARSVIKAASMHAIRTRTCYACSQTGPGHRTFQGARDRFAGTVSPCMCNTHISRTCHMRCEHVDAHVDARGGGVHEACNARARRLCPRLPYLGRRQRPPCCSRRCRP